MGIIRYKQKKENIVKLVQYQKRNMWTQTNTLDIEINYNYKTKK